MGGGKTKQMNVSCRAFQCSNFLVCFVPGFPRWHSVCAVPQGLAQGTAEPFGLGWGCAAWGHMQEEIYIYTKKAWFRPGFTLLRDFMGGALSTVKAFSESLPDSTD